MRTEFAALLLGAAALTGGCALSRTSSLAGNPGAWPPDVERFLERRQLCVHFLGEHPYDEQRRRFLRRAIHESCTGTDRELARLRARYRADAAVTTRLTATDEFLQLDESIDPFSPPRD